MTRMSEQVGGPQQPPREKWEVGGRIGIGLILFGLGANAFTAADDAPLAAIGGMLFAGGGLYQLMTAAVMTAIRRA